jgi:hypothetical protein
VIIISRISGYITNPFRMLKPMPKPTPWTSALAVCLLSLLSGCASTKVVKDPGPHDCGFRFYRSKPYLKITPKDASTPNMYTIEMVALPDYTEEYSAHIRAGLGTNSTELAFSEYGVLTSTTVNVDSKASELISSVASLLGTTPNLLRPPPAGGAETKVAPPDKATVTAFDVPIGYYEAVLTKGIDGKKRLYGWRYVGFMPSANCPTEMMGGGEAQCCNETELYGLVTVGNAMMFRRLSDIAQPKQVTVEKASTKIPEAKKEQ